MEIKMNKKTREIYEKAVNHPKLADKQIGVFAHFVYVVETVWDDLNYSGSGRRITVRGSLISHSGHIELQHREGSNHVDVMHYQWIRRQTNWARGYERRVGYIFSLDGTNNYPAYRKPRDTQKQRLYQAERHVQIGSPDIMTVNGVRKYVNQIVNTRWWKSHHPDIGHVIVKEGNGNQKRATGGLSGGVNPETKRWEHNIGVITLPQSEWARTEIVILHELAHVITSERPAHGKAYAKNFLTLVKRFLGDEDYKKLRDQFKAYKVKYIVRNGK